MNHTTLNPVAGEGIFNLRHEHRRIKLMFRRGKSFADRVATEAMKGSEFRDRHERLNHVERTTHRAKPPHPSA